MIVLIGYVFPSFPIRPAIEVRWSQEWYGSCTYHWRHKCVYPEPTSTICIASPLTRHIYWSAPIRKIRWTEPGAWQQISPSLFTLLFSWVECGFILYDQSIICPYHHNGWRQQGHCWQILTKRSGFWTYSDLSCPQVHPLYLQAGSVHIEICYNYN